MFTQVHLRLSIDFTMTYICHHTGDRVKSFQIQEMCFKDALIREKGKILEFIGDYWTNLGLELVKKS